MSKEKNRYRTVLLEHYAKEGSENVLLNYLQERWNILRRVGLITESHEVTQDWEDKRKFFELFTLTGLEAIQKIEDDRITALTEKSKAFWMRDLALLDSHYCTCSKLSAVLFVVDPLTGTSPLRCGKCHGEVSLYRFHNKEISIGNIKKWERIYSNLWHLFIFSNLYDDWADLELGHIDSKANKMGYELALNFQEKTKIRAYYFLAPRKKENYSSEYMKICPKCGLEWSTEDNPFPTFDYICHGCRLISSAPS